LIASGSSSVSYSASNGSGTPSTYNPWLLKLHYFSGEYLRTFWTPLVTTKRAKSASQLLEGERFVFAFPLPYSFQPRLPQRCDMLLQHCRVFDRGPLFVNFQEELGIDLQHFRRLGPCFGVFAQLAVDRS